MESAVAAGEKVGAIAVRLYRPFAAEAFVAALPASVRRIAVLDRTKEPGSVGEPLYLDVIAALVEHWNGTVPSVIGGRYGLSSKEFTPAMVLTVLDELSSESPKNHFTVGIADDVTHTSLTVDERRWSEPAEVTRALFYGLGSDGTVGANKNSVKIIGKHTDAFAQGYFVYDSKKSGSMTVSHLRFGPDPIGAPYLVTDAGFVACHNVGFLDRVDVLDRAAHGATFLLNCAHGPDEVWDHLPRTVQERILEAEIDLWVVDANRVAADAGLGGRVNTVLQTCFLYLADLMPHEEALAAVKQAVADTYGRRGRAVLQRNEDAVDAAVDALAQVTVPDAITSAIAMLPPVPDRGTRLRPAGHRHDDRGQG